MDRKDAELLLRKHFGLSHFYDRQWETIDNLLNGKNVLLIQSTGFGKSLCFQFPALIHHGITVVFSPLIALMNDQIRKLKKLGIPAECVVSDQSEETRKSIVLNIRRNKIKILYIAPERLINGKWLDIIRSAGISFVVIDEAHCISMWGHDFRPAYRRIVKFINVLPEKIPVLATTATLDNRAQEDVICQMGGKAVIIRDRLMRKGLALEVVRVNSEYDKLSYLMGKLPEFEGNGIIYAGTRKNAELYSGFLNQNKINSTFYHAGLEPEDKAEIERGLIANRWKCVVATIALGMGIDKPDLRFVIHTQMSSSITLYFQEIGRAGRDGNQARIVLLYNPLDRELPEHFIRDGLPTIENANRIMEILENNGPLLYHQIIEKSEMSETLTRISLHWLWERKVIRNDCPVCSGYYMINHDKSKYDSSYVKSIRKHKMDELIKMIRYIKTDRCRMSFLCEALGDNVDEDCQNCDNCLGKKHSYEANCFRRRKIRRILKKAQLLPVKK